jgi:hypothetical protein
MRFFWRSTANPLRGHPDWVEHVDPKNRQPGTSAPTLAASWSGPLDVLGALATQPELEGVILDRVVVEAKATFDSHRGNVRNHDLVLHGVTQQDEAVVVCVEAKAGESLGHTVTEQRKQAQRAQRVNDNSQAVARLDELLARLCRYPADDARSGALRYQLLTAWAGTLSDAAEAAHAVFVLHEFQTDERPDDRSAHNRNELDRFADAVLGCELPGRMAPWCARVPDVEHVNTKLYIAHVVTDLRREHVQGTAEMSRAM